MIRRIIRTGVVCALACLWARDVEADVHRLGVAPSGDQLPAALRTALAPWEVEIVPLEASPQNIGQATVLARAREVDAMVWITGAGADFTLWVYDASDAKLLGKRVVSAPPYDGPTAAAVSLSVKTLLRHSLVAPEPERFGAASAPPPPAAPMGPYRFALAAGPGVRAFADTREGSSSTAADVRFGFELAWYPTAIWLGFVVALDLGADRTVDERDFVGRFRDQSLGLSLRGRYGLGERLSTHLQAGAAVRATSVVGRVVSLGQEASEQRFNPALNLELGASVHVLANLHLRLSVGAELLLRRQRYTVFDDPVVTVPRTAGVGRLLFEVPIL